MGKTKERLLKPIETHYNGYRFRSRLEARWAVFFDALGIKYEYEKEGYDLGEAGWYLPDFWLTECNRWVEIKGQKFTEGELNKAIALCEATGHPVLTFDGLPDIRDFIGITKCGDGVGTTCADFIYLFVNDEGKVSLPPGFYLKNTYQEIGPFKSEYVMEFAIRLKKASCAAKAARFEHGESGIKVDAIQNKKLTAFEIFKYKYYMRSAGHLMEEILNTLENGYPAQIRDKILVSSVTCVLPIKEDEFNEINVTKALFKYFGEGREIGFLLHDVDNETLEYDKVQNNRAKNKNRRHPFGYCIIDQELIKTPDFVAREFYLNV